MIGVWGYFGFNHKYLSSKYYALGLFKETVQHSYSDTSNAQNLWNTSISHHIQFGKDTIHTTVGTYIFKDLRVYLNYESNAFELIDAVHAQANVLCSEECLDCSSPVVCAICKDGFYLSAGVCQPCHYTCHTCDQAGKTGCSSCVELLVFNPDSSCSTSCPASYYIDGKVCARCRNDCLLCDALTTCTQCPQGLVLNASGQCVSCPSFCLTCSKESSCLTCKEGFFNSSGLCEVCGADCRTCERAAECLSCLDEKAEVVSGLCSCRAGTGVLFHAPLQCLACTEGTYLSGLTCEDCHEDCLTCSSFPQCDTCKDSAKGPAISGCQVCPPKCLECSIKGCDNCIEGASLTTSRQCQCNEGFSEIKDACLENKIVTYTLSLTEENAVVLNFSQAVFLLESDVLLLINAHEVAFKLEGVSEIEYMLLYSDAQSSPISVTVFEVQDPSGENSLVVEPSSASIELATTDSPKTDEEQTVDTVRKVTENSSTAVGAVVAILSFMSGNFTMLWTLINAFQILRYIPYVDIDLPPAIAAYYNAGLTSRIPNFFTYFVHSDSRATAGVKRLGYKTSVFLFIAGDSFTVLAGILIAWVLCLLLSKICCSDLASIFSKLLTKFKWNSLLRFTLQYFIPLLFASLLQLTAFDCSSASNATNSFLASFVLVLCVGFTVAVCVFIFKNFQNLNELFEQQSLYGTLFIEFKNDQSVLSSAYYPIYLLRRTLYISQLLLLPNYPVAQMIINIAHSLPVTSSQVLLFLIVLKPFKSSLVNLSNILFEASVVLAFTLTSLFLLEIEGLEMLQWIIICIVNAAVLANMVIAVILAYVSLRDRVRRWRRLRNEGKAL